VKEGSTEIVEMLLNHKADPNVVNKKRSALAETPLSIAVNTNKLEIVKRLLDKNANLTQEKIFDMPLEEVAITNGNVEILRALLSAFAKKGQLDVNKKNSMGNTLLITAASKGHAEIVEELLNQRADIDAVNIQSNSALHLAVQEGHAAVVKKLLEYGAKKDIKNYYNEPPLQNVGDRKDIPEKYGYIYK
jgi:ankyrin repeat protein